MMPSCKAKHNNACFLKVLLLVFSIGAPGDDAFSSPPSSSVRIARNQPVCHGPAITTTSLRLGKQHSYCNDGHHLSAADKDRLLMGGIGLTAFIVAEMRHFVNETVVEFDQGLRFEKTKWSMTLEEKIQIGLATADSSSTRTEQLADGFMLDPDYASAVTNMTSDEAVDIICNITQTAFSEGFRQTGLLSALGSAILYFRGYYQTPKGIAACERIGLSDYDVAHHITDMYHHRTFRGAYTKTLSASGKGEIAAALAVGLEPEEESSQQSRMEKSALSSNDQDKNIMDDDDECLLWSPTTPGLCLYWKSDDEKWRKTRFERIQMEGTKDPRRGGSGTTR